LFDQLDVSDEVMHAGGYRMALIPAVDLNKIGKPQVYDHFYAGISRRELLKAAELWESGAAEQEEEQGANWWKGEDPQPTGDEEKLRTYGMLSRSSMKSAG
jgi:hypothetical protein